MDPIRTPQQQARVTDFFSNVLSSHTRSTGKNSASCSVLSRKLLSSSDKNPILSVSDDLKPLLSAKNNNNNNNNNMSTITPGKRKLKDAAGASESATRKRAKADKKVSSSTTTSRSIKSMISFGPRVSKLDFESETTTKTTENAPVIQSEPTEPTKSSNTATSTSTVEESPSTVTFSGTDSATSPTKSISLNVTEIKEKLKGCKNLANLKQHLASINGCADKLKEFKSMKVSVLSPVKNAYAKLSPQKVRNPEKFSLSGLTMIPSPLKTAMPGTPSKKLSSPYLANCVSSPRAQIKLACSRKLFESSDDSSNSCDANNNVNNNHRKTLPSDNVIPAYRRFAYLSKAPTSTIKNSKGPAEEEVELPLPVKYKRLGDLFKRLDYFVWHYNKRQEMCTFDKLKQKIELATRRTFELPMLMKILTVLSRNDKKWFALGFEVIANTNQLTITPLYPEYMKSIHSVNMLLEREKGFHQSLLELTKEEHLKFLAEMKLTLSPDMKVYNWHPMFKLDSVADIEPDMTLLPRPNQPKPKLAAPNSILNYFVPRNGSKPVIVKEEPIKVEVKEDVNTQPQQANSSGSTSTVNPAETERVKGIPLHLLNKVREKEAAAKARLMFRPPEIDRELDMLVRLPAMIRIIDRFYQSSKARSHTYDQVVKKVAESMKLSITVAQKHVDYMISLELRANIDDISKRWLIKESFSNLDYLMMNQHDYKLVFLLEQISSRVQHLTKQ